MDHGLELIIPSLEILEIEVFNILYNPGNIGDWIFPIFYYPGNIGNWIFPIFWYPGNTGGGRAAPGARLRGAWIVFGTCYLFGTALIYPRLPPARQYLC